MIGLLTLIGLGVLVGVCASDSDDEEDTYLDEEECWRCGEMVSPDSDGDYICDCGRRWR